MASLLRTETVNYEGASVTVQGQTLLTSLRRSELDKRLTEVITLGVDYLYAYLTVITQTLSADGLPFTLPTHTSDNEAHQAAFEQYLNLPGEFQLAWYNACVNASLPPGTQADADVGDQKDPKDDGNTSST